MAFFEDVFKGGNIATGLGVAIGAAVLGPVVLPVVGAIVRPVAKTAIKVGMMAYDAAAEGLSTAGAATAGAAGGTGIGALFSEARAEVDAQRAARPNDRTARPGETPKPSERARAANA